MTMHERQQALMEQLVAAVQDRIAGGGEDALLTAYEVGRNAVTRHLNALDMLALQQETLLRLLVQQLGDEEGARLTQTAAEVFAESLAPFELTARSAQEGNTLLRHLNTELELKVAERTAQLAESEERFLSFMQHSPLAAYIKDEQGRYVYANEQLTRWFTRSAPAWAGKTDNELWPAPAAHRFPATAMTVLHHGQAIAREETTEHDDGVRHWLSITFPLTTATGQRLVGGVSVDMTEQVRLREQLIERERLAAIGTTAAKLVHEIGNPLNGMSVALQLLQRRLSKYPLDETIHASVQSLRGQIALLSNLLQEFRSLSRRREFRFRPTNLAELVDEVVTAELPFYTERRIGVEKRCDPVLVSLSADGDKLKQVLLNLCKNAVEAMPNGGTLTVRSAVAGTWAILEVADTGEGIPDGVDILEPFVTTKANGTGLGLPIVRQIVAAHGGTLTYRSARGRGTIFTVTLPLPGREERGNDA